MPTIGLAPLAHSIPDAARMIGIGETTLYDLLAKEKIRRCRIGRRVVIPHAELERFLAEQTSEEDTGAIA